MPGPSWFWPRPSVGVGSGQTRLRSPRQGWPGALQQPGNHDRCFQTPSLVTPRLAREWRGPALPITGPSATRSGAGSSSSSEPPATQQGLWESRGRGGRQSLRVLKLSHSPSWHPKGWWITTAAGRDPRVGVAWGLCPMVVSCAGTRHSAARNPHTCSAARPRVYPSPLQPRHQQLKIASTGFSLPPWC